MCSSVLDPLGVCALVYARVRVRVCVRVRTSMFVRVDARCAHRVCMCIRTEREGGRDSDGGREGQARDGGTGILPRPQTRPPRAGGGALGGTTHPVWMEPTLQQRSQVITDNYICSEHNRSLSSCNVCYYDELTRAPTGHWPLLSL